MEINNIELNFDNLSKEQVFVLGLLFNSVSETKLSAVDLLSKEQIVKVCKELEINDSDIRFYCDFKYHTCKREDLARKYYCHIGHIYNKFNSIKNKIEKFLLENTNIMGL